MDELDALYNSFRMLLEITPTAFIRSFHEQINWENRLIGLLGQKGVGKSTLILQHIRNYDDPVSTLYVQADDLYFSSHTLYDTAYSFYANGGKRLYIDEIHKYGRWSTELKLIYDKLPKLYVVYSGSCLLELEKGAKADLSRRTREYTMPGLSFREYLNIRFGWSLKTASLDDVLKGKVDFPYSEHRPLIYFKDYCRIGYYPFFQAPDALIKLQQVVKTVVEDDIPKYANMNTTSTDKLKKLMFVLSKSAPFKPNYSKLAKELEMSRNQIPEYLLYLSRTGLFNILRDKSNSDSLLLKVEKLYLNNANIAYALSGSYPDAGTLRETVFLSLMQEKFNVTSSKVSDFEIDGVTFEVGGKSKTGRQLKEASSGYIVKDDIEYAYGMSIPLWMFGFIY